MKRSNLKKAREELKIPEDMRTRLGSSSTPLRERSVKEAISWPKGRDFEHKRYHKIYSCGRDKVCLGKPGVESLPSFKPRNINDMRPSIFLDGRFQEKNISFVDIFGYLEQIGLEDTTALELLGALLFRDAFMLDHIEKKGVLVYSPPEPVLQELERRVPYVKESPKDIPMRIFIHFIEALALNEDVKYKTLRHIRLNEGIGRRNNLLTCTNIVAVFLHKIPIARLIGRFASQSRGVAPITQKKAFEVFPFLAGD